MVGLVMTGTSLGSSQTASTMNEYLAYYEKEGFEFSKEKKKDQKEISNVTEFLKQQVESGELKYLIKEAHSDGDDKNLFRMSTKANLLVGVNRKTIEKIYLAIPSPADNNSTLLSNQEFGQWIREREKKGGIQQKHSRPVTKVLRDCYLPLFATARTMMKCEPNFQKMKNIKTIQVTVLFSPTKVAIKIISPRS